MIPPLVSANPAHATLQVRPFNPLESVKLCFTAGANSSIEKVPTSKIMAASPLENHLSTVVLTWANKDQNSCAHVLLTVPL